MLAFEQAMQQWRTCLAVISIQAARDDLGATIHLSKRFL